MSVEKSAMIAQITSPTCDSHSLVSERKPVGSIRCRQLCLLTCLSTLKSRNCISQSLNLIAVLECLWHLGDWCFLLWSHLPCTSPHDSWEKLSLPPVSLWVMGRGQAMNKSFFFFFLWLILHPSPLPQNLNFSFCGKQNLLFIAPSMRLYGPWITWYPRGNFKD